MKWARANEMGKLTLPPSLSASSHFLTLWLSFSLPLSPFHFSFLGCSLTTKFPSVSLFFFFAWSWFKTKSLFAPSLSTWKNEKAQCHTAFIHQTLNVFVWFPQAHAVHSQHIPPCFVQYIIYCTKQGAQFYIWVIKEKRRYPKSTLK